MCTFSWDMATGSIIYLFPRNWLMTVAYGYNMYVTCLQITVTYVGRPSLSPVTNWTVSPPQFLFWSPHLHVTVFWGGIFRKTIKVKWGHQGGTLILFHGCPCKRKTLQRSVSHARTPRKGHVRSQQGSGRRKQGEGSPQKPALWTWSGTCRL